MRPAKVKIDEVDAEILRAFAECDMRVARTAERMHYVPQTISQRLNMIRRITGTDPRSFWGLCRLLRMTGGEAEYGKRLP